MSAVSAKLLTVAVWIFVLLPLLAISSVEASPDDEGSDGGNGRKNYEYGEWTVDINK